MRTLLVLRSPSEGTGWPETWSFSGSDDHVLRSHLDGLDAFQVEPPEEDWDLKLSAVTQSREIGGRPRCCFIRTTESRAYFCRLLRPHGPPKARYAWRSRCRNALMISARRSMHGSVTDARTLPPRQAGAPDTRYERAQFDEEWHSRSSAERGPLPFPPEAARREASQCARSGNE